MNNSYQSKITKEEIAELPLTKFNEEIIVIDNKKKLEAIIADLKKERILGFDTETRPAFKKGRTNKVALLQLSSEHKAYLFRLNKIGLPDSLKEILSDDKTLKIGIAIRDDIKILQKLNKFEANSFVELQQFVKQFNIENNGMKKLAGIVLKSKISKAQQLSNWENETLTEAQLNYAATDAWICYKIYKKLSAI
ncbi:MAG: 3'-5' exonuclease domain-containing protein 2 [Bacteroidetes bacterium]|nr:MAG: 3'-5' exonuclease domain-containing protein 2 [Bacteroidota bacterium]